MGSDMVYFGCEGDSSLFFAMVAERVLSEIAYPSGAPFTIIASVIRGRSLGVFTLM